MKGFLAICVFTIAVSSTLAIDEAAQKQAIGLFKKCREQNPIPDNEAEMIKKNQGVPTSPVAKCLAKCMLVEGKILSGKKYNKGAAIAFVEAIHSDNAEEADKAKRVIEECFDTVGETAGDDECEYSFKMAQCAFNKSKEYGVLLPNWA